MGYDQLVGEVIRIDADKATIQVYEETGEYDTGQPLQTTHLGLKTDSHPLAFQLE